MHHRNAPRTSPICRQSDGFTLDGAGQQHPFLCLLLPAGLSRLRRVGESISRSCFWSCIDGWTGSTGLLQVKRCLRQAGLVRFSAFLPGFYSVRD